MMSKAFVVLPIGASLEELEERRFATDDDPAAAIRRALRLADRHGRRFEVLHRSGKRLFLAVPGAAIPRPVRESLVVSRRLTSYSYNHETEEHGCGKRQGQSPPCAEAVDNGPIVDRLGVGDSYGYSVDAPGAGRVAWVVTRVDDAGLWGVKVVDAARELTAEDVR